MKNDTLKITTGAMFIAIFALLLLVNRQTGSVFSSLIMYLLPIPMVAYSARFGFKAGLPVLAGMGLITFFLGSVTTVLYAVTEAFTGLIFGTCINKKTDPTKTLFAVMGLSVASTLLNTIIYAELFGGGLTSSTQTALEEYRTILMDYVTKAAQYSSRMKAYADIYDKMLTPDFLLRLLIICLIIMGLLQGFLIYEISLWILHRLRFQIKKPCSLLLYFPPKWSGVLAFAFVAAYYYSGYLSSETAKTILQTAAMVAFLYLVCFGFIAIVYCIRLQFPQQKVIAAIGAFLLMAALSPLVMILGLIYIVTDLHKETLEMFTGNAGKKEAG